MYQEDQRWERPPPDAKIWRYCNFAKFKSLLEKKALFFCRADKLEDKFEGSYSRANIPSRESFCKSLPRDKGQNLQKGLENIHKKAPKMTFLSCWCRSDDEDHKMWKLYSDSNEGVAIQSTVKHLTQSLGKPDEVDVRMVRYIDYDTQSMPEGPLFVAFRYKRKEFEHERELRAIISKDDYLNKRKEDIEPGIYAEVNLDLLIQKVVVSPTAPARFRESVESVLNEYGLKKEVLPSSLSSEPSVY